LFLAGPRQVGKTTASFYAKHFTNQFTYLNWDNEDHRELILKGPVVVAEYAGLHKIHHKMPIIVFDEIHKYRHWKTFIKGFFDGYKDKFHSKNVFVTVNLGILLL
jgi:predicted AAA+ superfamily ATPase